MYKNYKATALALIFSSTLPTINAINNGSEHGPVKKLASPMLPTINAIFTANPDFAAGIIIKLDISCSAAKRVLQDLPNMQEAQVPDQLAKVLRSVMEYLGDLKDQKALIAPLIQESFGNDRYAKSILSEMLAANKTIVQFFADRIKTRADLGIICQELSDFFNDFKHSLSGPYLALAEQKKNALKKAAAVKHAALVSAKS
jgi:hypothetical protein